MVDRDKLPASLVHCSDVVLGDYRGSSIGPREINRFSPTVLWLGRYECRIVCVVSRQFTVDSAPSGRYIRNLSGGVSEWLKEAVLKTVVP